ncbi:hypothetical protein [Streptomyces mirabilis]|uniref:hypothetical protein n=1 Tax=Streptomyces mirabilis TaxID=68239 RepID=UPI003815B1AA
MTPRSGRPRPEVWTWSRHAQAAHCRCAAGGLGRRDGLVLDSWAAYWLGELADTIDDRDDPAERARFTGWLESFVRAIHGHARERNQPSTTAEEARRALTLATEFTYQERPEFPRQVPRSQTGNPPRRERRRTRADRPDR